MKNENIQFQTTPYDYYREYSSLFEPKLTSTGFAKDYDPYLESSLKSYDDFHKKVLADIDEYITANNITFESLLKNPYTREGTDLKELVSLLCLKSTPEFVELLNKVGLGRLEDFIINTSKVKAELKYLTDYYQLPTIVHKPIFGLVSQMVYLKTRATVEEILEHIKKTQKGHVVISKNLTDKAYRMSKENKRKDEYESEAEELLFSDKGEEFLEKGRQILSKNKSGSYNMKLIAETIFNTVTGNSTLKGKPKAQQYSSIFTLFRLIYPERKMFVSLGDLDESNEHGYVDFDEYVQAAMKTILGLTR